MKKIKFIATLIILSIPTVSYSEVVEVFTWKAFPGKGQVLLQNMNIAANIHRSQGVQVSINAHDIGSTQLTDYVLRWDDIDSWAKTKDSQRNSPEWLQFWADAAENPAGELVTSFSGGNLDQTKKASDFTGSWVYSVNVWDPHEGKEAEVLQRFQVAKEILEKSGARVEIYGGGWGSNGLIHYVLMYKSWADLAESFSKLGPGSDWSTFLAANSEVIADELSYFTGQTLN